MNLTKGRKLSVEEEAEKKDWGNAKVRGEPVKDQKINTKDDQLCVVEEGPFKSDKSQEDVVEEDLVKSKKVQEDVVEEVKRILAKVVNYKRAQSKRNLWKKQYYQEIKAIQLN